MPRVPTLARTFARTSCRWTAVHILLTSGRWRTTHSSRRILQTLRRLEPDEDYEQGQKERLYAPGQTLIRITFKTHPILLLI